MARNLFLICTLIALSLPIHASQKPFNSCWFLILPIEIRNLIASFLVFDDIEDEQEFIERTKKMRIEKIPIEWLNRYPKEYSDPESSIAAYCPNNKIYALFFQAKAYHPQPHSALLIIDTINDKQLDASKIYDKRKDYRKIAISRGGNLFAFIKTVDNKTTLTIKNFNTQQKEIHHIPWYFNILFEREHPAIAFHKEETSIILHSANDQHHFIFPITSNKPNPTLNRKKTLEKYCQQHNIFQRCFFANIPLEVMNLIAYFLDIETEKEFIQRTQAIIFNEVPKWCFNLIPKHQFGMPLQYAYCPEQKYIALLQSTQEKVPNTYPCTSVYQTLFIIDKEKKTLMHQQKFSNKGNRNIALSSNAHMLAMTHLECDTSGDLCTDVIKYQTMITLKEIKAIPQKTKIFELHKHHDTFDFINPSIFFNKQETHLITHYTKHDSMLKSIKEYKIIPIDPQNPSTLTHGTLENYFAKKWVCKNIMEQAK